MGSSNIFPQPPPAQPNMFSNPMELLYGLGTVNQLARFGQEQNALRSYTQSLGPSGQVDPGALARRLQANGATFGAPEVMSSAIQNQTQSLALRAAQTQAVMEQFAALGNNPKASKEDVFNTTARTSRLFDPGVVPSDIPLAIQQMLLKDPDGVPAAARKLQAQLAGSAQSMGRVTGPPDVTTGAPMSYPAGAVHVTGGVPTGLPPGSEASASVMQGDLARAGNYGQEIFPWKQALEKLQALGPAGIGPGTEGRKQLASFIYSALGPTIARWGGIDPERLKNFDEAQKYLTQATLQRAASFGHGTDQQLATTITGNPNVHINDLAAVDVTKMAIATRAMEHAQTLYAAKFGPAGYTKAKADFAAQQDPRAYLMATGLASPEQIAAWKDTLKGAERDKFNRSLRTAKEAGLY